MSTTLQAILETGLEDYLQNHTLLDYQKRAVRDLLRCRTAALGGHAKRCPDEHIVKVWYNSCRHRSCPQCAYLQMQKWLEKRESQLLPCDHYHVIFTLAGELRVLWRWNPEIMADVLFQSVRETLFTLLADQRHLGALPGVVAALHTWGRTLSLHPHVHCLVSGGGLTAEGGWRAVRNGYLLPIAAARVMFRGKLLSAIERLLRRGALRLPPDLSVAAALGLLKRSARKKWNVCIPERHDDVAMYLARYLRGGPIKNSRLLHHDRQSVTFRYKDHRSAQENGGKAAWAKMTLPMEEFLGRVLQHIPRPGQHMVRLYGLYSRSQGEALEKCRQQILAAAALDPAAARPPRERPKWQPEPACCPVCGKLLVRGESIPRGPPARLEARLG